MTILEVIVCIAIIVTLVSITAPAIAKAKQKAQIANTLSNLRQIFLGLSLYRENYGSNVDFGSASEMGLPPNLMISEAALKEVVGSKAVWRSPCCCHPDASSGAPTYTTYLTDYSEYFHAEDAWTDYVMEYRNEAVLVYDLHCNDRGLSFTSPVSPVLGVGVRLGGHVTIKRGALSPGNIKRFWNTD